MKKILPYITSAVLWFVFGIFYWFITVNIHNTLRDILIYLYFIMSNGIFSLIVWIIMYKKKDSTLADKIIYPINAFVFFRIAFYVFVFTWYE